MAVPSCVPVLYLGLVVADGQPGFPVHALADGGRHGIHSTLHLCHRNNQETRPLLKRQTFKNQVTADHNGGGGGGAKKKTKGNMAQTQEIYANFGYG